MPELERGNLRPSGQRQKLVFLLPSLRGGGAERVASLLIPYFDKHFDLTVVLLENIRSYEIPPTVNSIAFSPPLYGKISHLIRIPYHVIFLIMTLKKLGAKTVLSFMEEANIINIMSSLLIGYQSIIGQRIVPHLQYNNKGLLGIIIYKLSRVLYKKATHILTVSSHLRDILLREFAIEPERVSFIPNPVNTQSLTAEALLEPHISLPNRYILHVGRLNTAHKGQDVLLHAFALIADQFPDLSLVLVGEGPDRARLVNLVTAWKLEGRVIFAGWQKNVAAIMEGADAFVLPSRYEGWPNVLMEAMACGCPVIATDCVSGPREILADGRYGLLAPVGDPVALADIIQGLLMDGPLRKTLAARGRDRVASFASKRVASCYIELIESQRE
jgi:N-acetylgalactosamine-N,N'-diacetylbacillosaminyl-diphospho-undecaprenol 4-alpha-N-acetylgalactosaminyltransferase